jgi:hemoglobin/transferrin/lactoferrin receptor protein
MLLCVGFSFSQTKNDTVKSISELSELVISTKLPTDYSKLPTQVVAISAKQIDFQNFQSTAELLSNSGTLFVQKSQQGGGSPAIRGFEASRVLLLVDGVRMNNLIFRAGHLQNVITVDESMLENVGIFYGPTSTLFGSDALGGTVAMTTKRAKFLDETKNKLTGGINTRYSSVNKEKSIAFTLNYAVTNFASLSILSFNDFGDLKMGKEKNHNGDYFGERPTYVITVNGVDQLNSNNDKYTQVGSAYKQYNFLQKFAYKTASGFAHGLNFQFSTSSNINRYDRLTETAGSGLKFSEWYYGPQQRVLGVYSLSKEKALLGSDLKLNVAFQNAKESRHNRRFGNYNLQNRNENVMMYSVGIDLHKKFIQGDLFYGFESYSETLNSTAFANNINTGVRTDLDTRYPNGHNNMMRNDVYLSYNEKIAEKTVTPLGDKIQNTKVYRTVDEHRTKKALAALSPQGEPVKPLDQQSDKAVLLRYKLDILKEKRYGEEDEALFKKQLKGQSKLYDQTKPIKDDIEKIENKLKNLKEIKNLSAADQISKLEQELTKKKEALTHTENNSSAGKAYNAVVARRTDLKEKTKKATAEKELVRDRALAQIYPK